MASEARKAEVERPWMGLQRPATLKVSTQTFQNKTSDVTTGGFMKKLLLPILLVFSIQAMAEDDQLSVPVYRLTLDAANSVAQAAIDECRKQGIQAGVTVVDRNGIVQVALRDTLAPQITLPISKGKALAAVNFGVSTADLADRANTPIGRVPGLVMSQGGLLIQAAGNNFGAVGVSGAPSGATDEECAQAGVNAIQDDLEMSL